MVYCDAMSKASRLVELQTLFWRQPRRIRRTGELAEHLGIAERTVRKYIAELSASGRLPVVHEHRGWRLVEAARMEVPPVNLQVEEAAAVYLAARLLERSSDEPNPAVRGALARLADVVPEAIRPAFRHLTARRSGKTSRFSRSFSALARGWILGKEVRLSYRPRTGEGTRRYSFHPYLLEPSAVGSAVYAIGHAEPPGEIRVLKVERVSHAALTGKRFDPPPLRRLLQQIDQAWGIWLGPGEPDTVDLRFTPAVAQRVRETRWHPSQRLQDGEDGSVLLTLSVTSWREILPWVLGWGAQCTVLGPAALRDAVAAELEAAARQYS